MTSTGNDIISLNDIDISRTTQSKFYSKILSDTEKDLYCGALSAAIPFESFVWLLWSVKESAYKYLQRIKPDLVFSPTKFIVKQIQVPLGYTVTNFAETEREGTGFNSETVYRAIVTFGSDILYSRSFLYQELIMSVVNADEKFENTWWGFKLINKTDDSYQSADVRAFLIARLERIFNLDNFSINKSPHGFPIILSGCEELALPVSLSHHHHFVAYSFQLLPFLSSVINAAS